MNRGQAFLLRTGEGGIYDSFMDIGGGADSDPAVCGSDRAGKQQRE